MCGMAALLNQHQVLPRDIIRSGRFRLATSFGEWVFAAATTAASFLVFQLDLQFEITLKWLLLSLALLLLLRLSKSLCTVDIYNKQQPPPPPPPADEYCISLEIRIRVFRPLMIFIMKGAVQCAVCYGQLLKIKRRGTNTMCWNRSRRQSVGPVNSFSSSSFDTASDTDLNCPGTF